MGITYGITVHNELNEIIRLLEFLSPMIGVEDEILVQYDSENVTKEVVDYLNITSQLNPRIRIIGFPLAGDFASFKNNIKIHSNGIYIFQIDADEMPSEYLVKNIHEILEFNKEVDLFLVPRVNTVDGLTGEWVRKWNWRVDDMGRVNYPDYQTRIYRRTSEIEWTGKVHERIIGYNTVSILPQEDIYSLYHPKDIERQIKQNELYSTM